MTLGLKQAGLGLGVCFRDSKTRRGYVRGDKEGGRMQGSFPVVWQGRVRKLPSGTGSWTSLTGTYLPVTSLCVGVLWGLFFHLSISFLSFIFCWSSPWMLPPFGLLASSWCGLSHFSQSSCFMECYRYLWLTDESNAYSVLIIILQSSWRVRESIQGCHGNEMGVSRERSVKYVMLLLVWDP